MITKDTIKHAQRIVGTNNDGGRPETDFYPTSPETTMALINWSKNNEQDFEGEVWECACGKGDMSKVLEKYYKVISTDLFDYQYGQSDIDFLETNKLLAPNIVTNPPFKLANKFVVHGMELGARKMALLCKLAFLEGTARSKIFEKYPPRNVLVFKKRILLTRNGEKPRGSGMIAFAWFIWQRNWSRHPQIDWI